MKFVLIFFVAIFAVFFVFITMNDNSQKEKKLDEVTESNEDTNKEQKLIGDINSIKLYQTDFVYNQVTTGYDYTEVALSTIQINYIKEALKDVDLNNTVSATVYGQFKLVIDDKIIFFDANNDYALYMGTNKEFVLPKDKKIKIANTTNTCSCCTTVDCKINLCKCNN